MFCFWYFTDCNLQAAITVLYRSHALENEIEAVTFLDCQHTSFERNDRVTQSIPPIWQIFPKGVNESFISREKYSSIRAINKNGSQNLFAAIDPINVGQLLIGR